MLKTVLFVKNQEMKIKIRFKRFCKRGHDTNLKIYYNKINGIFYPECAECRKLRQKNKKFSKAIKR